MSDKELYKLCKKFGRRVLEARRKFAGLLPEVFRRGLYAKKGFLSIYEFAAKLAGMNHEQVDVVLRLERKFEDKPVLRQALVEGEISANKLARIVSIATTENQEELFEKAKILSKNALEVFVKDFKRENLELDSKNSAINLRLNLDSNLMQIPSSNGSVKPLFNQKILPGQELKLDSDVEKELTEMQEKGIDVNEFLRNALQKRKEEIEEQKNQIVEKQEKKLQNKETELIGKQCQTQKAPISHYVSVKIRKIVKEEHGTKCSYPGCTRPAKNLHHTQRLSLTKTHDPHFIAPLCEEHHEIAHKIDIKYAQIAASS